MDMSFSALIPSVGGPGSFLREVPGPGSNFCATPAPRYYLQYDSNLKVTDQTLTKFKSRAAAIFYAWFCKYSHLH
jgi:hypothetical protein